jgi:homoserine O-succinyltransferase
VSYWDELRRVFDWTQTHVHRTFAICWAALAALRHFHGVNKHPLPAKHSGIFSHRIARPASPWLRGFSDDFVVPVSRWTEVRQADLPRDRGLTVLADSAETGLCLLDDAPHRMLQMFNHVEYDTTTLAEEYARDSRAGPAPVPRNYFPDDDPSRPPPNRWRSHAHLLIGNWINEIYQTAPFDLSKIGDLAKIGEAPPAGEVGAAA